MAQDSNRKLYDLEDRTYDFARNVRKFLKQLPKDIANNEDSKQLARSSGSIGANYIEANEALSKKDFAYRIRICRKEAKESRFWLRLVDFDHNQSLEQVRDELINECSEMIRIFSSIVNKTA